MLSHFCPVLIILSYAWSIPTWCFYLEWPHMFGLFWLYSCHCPSSIHSLQAHQFFFYSCPRFLASMYVPSPAGYSSAHWDSSAHGTISTCLTWNQFTPLLFMGRCETPPRQCLAFDAQMWASVGGVICSLLFNVISSSWNLLHYSLYLRYISYAFPALQMLLGTVTAPVIVYFPQYSLAYTTVFRCALHLCQCHMKAHPTSYFKVYGLNFYTCPLVTNLGIHHHLIHIDSQSFLLFLWTFALFLNI